MEAMRADAHEPPGQPVEPACGLAEGGWYCIEVRGHLDPRWSEWLGGLSICHTPAGRTRLCGRIADQAALNGLLNTIYDLGLPLLGLARSEPEPAPGPACGSEG